jgi:hypothetical protein
MCRIHRASEGKEKSVTERMRALLAERVAKRYEACGQ